MIVLSAKDLNLAFGVDVILEDISFHINEGDRIGIVGENGAGKTTLLKILTDEIKLDSGDIFMSQNITVGYLKQKDNFNHNNTVIDEVNSIFENLAAMEQRILEVSHEIAETNHDVESEKSEALLKEYDQLQHDFEMQGGYTYKSEIKGVLNSMAFSEEYYEKEIEMLSGGERTRLALACLLLKKPNLLFLDEPTNHLDIGTLKWLEQYLKAYKGTVVIVSHDRYFLNETVNRIFEVRNHKLHQYDGNYNEFAIKKRLQREDEIRKYQANQKEIEKQEEIIRRFKGRGTEKLAKRAASREKKLANIEHVAKPESEKGKMKIHFKEKFKSGNDVVFAENLSKSFGYGSNKVELFENVNLDIKRGDRICILGPNGVGKTTLLRILLGELKANSGYLKMGHNIDIGYYDQGQLLLNEDLTLIEELQESYAMYGDTEMRSILGRFQFRNDQVFLPIRALSGGEKARLSLLKLMLSGSNLLILDEPTNHLDIDSKEIFEDALMDFPGTVIVVSHDRYFLSKIPTRILELGHYGITQYLGKYDYYVEKSSEIVSGKKYLNEMGAADKARNDTSKEVKIDAAEERRKKKEKEALERRLEREKEACEKNISNLENEISNVENEMCKEKTLTDHVKLGELNTKLDNLNENLQKEYEKWLQYD